ncbi:MAG TPA: mechanosensitive ion channel domain-containing protein [Bryobacteraceae bacterium]|nr:mechanosensitive ion channel domain-containing protein [Bryobacteraceae bacterium]
MTVNDWLKWDPAHLFALGRMLAMKTIAAAGIFMLFWIVAAVTTRMILRFVGRGENAHGELLVLIGRTAKVSLLVFGALTALGTAGINVSALVAGLGLTGFALGFAFRDVLSNVLAGFLILLYRPFGHGDVVSVTGLEGTVLHIDLRYTSLDAAGKTILIPNSNLFTNPIVVAKKPVGV